MLLQGGGSDDWSEDESEYDANESDAEDDSDAEDENDEGDTDATTDDEEEDEEDYASEEEGGGDGASPPGVGPLFAPWPAGSGNNNGLSARLLAEVRARGSAAVLASKAAVRDAKGFFSSDYEALMLAATKPDDDEAPPEELVDRLVATVGTFARGVDVGAATNPYRTTLRKLWLKLSERDWRTTLKALYLLHGLLARCEPEDGAMLRAAHKKLGRETDPRTGGPYFDLARVTDIGGGKGGGGWDAALAVGGGPSDVQVFGPLVAAYAKFVLKRFATFTAGFEELFLIGAGNDEQEDDDDEEDDDEGGDDDGEGGGRKRRGGGGGGRGGLSTDDMVAQLFKAKKLVDLGLACEVSPDAECGLSVAVLDAVALDLQGLSSLYNEKLNWVEAHRGGLFAGWGADDAEALLAGLHAYRTATLRPRVEGHFLHEARDLLELYGRGKGSRTGLLAAEEEDEEDDDDDDDEEEEESDV